MARDIRYKPSPGQVAYHPEAGHVWQDPTLHRLADALLAAPALLTADLALLLTRFRGPLPDGDDSLRTACQTLSSLGSPAGGAFQTAVLDFYGTPGDFRLRVGLLFELIIYKLLSTRYDDDPPVEWCEHNVKVGRMVRRLEWFEHCDLDVAGWSRRQQIGEFYSLRVGGAFQPHELQCYGELARFLEDDESFIVVGVWSLTRTAHQFRIALDAQSPPCPANVRVFGWDNLATVSRSVPI